MDELEQLHAQIAEMQAKAESLVAKKKSSVILDIKAKMRAYGITAKDLGYVDKAGHSSAGTTVAPKYRLGDTSWTGRGRKPKPIEDYVTSGGLLDDLLIK